MAKQTTDISKIIDPVKRIFAFAEERHKITLLKQNNAPRPWTKDPVLRDYRFCCVYRELDKVTLWITNNWRTPNADNPDLWFALCLARLLNQPDSLTDVGFPVPWNKRKFLTALKKRERAGERIFNAAYIVSTNGVATNKVEYLADHVLDPLWKARERLRPKAGDSLNGFHMLLGQMQGFGSFMTAQVIADVKYVPPLRDAGDWWTFAASGPGSRRGLNYVLGRDRNDKWTEDNWRLELGRLREKLLPMFAAAKMPKPHAQDIQNLLCEWSKYWKAVTTGKMPKQRYRGEGK